MTTEPPKAEVPAVKAAPPSPDPEGDLLDALDKVLVDLHVVGNRLFKGLGAAGIKRIASAADSLLAAIEEGTEKKKPAP